MKKSRPIPLLQKATQTYRRIFSIHEIEADPILQWCLGFFLLNLFMNLKFWSASLSTTLFAVGQHTAVCWPFFQHCTKWIFLDLPPYGYSQLIFFNIFYIFIAASAFFIYRKNWIAAHLCMLIPYLVRFYLLAISANYFGNLWLYITYFGFIFLFLPHKRFFAQLQVVMCYFLASSSKISEAWTLGTYFSNMQIGLPLAPHGTEIILTNIVLLMEMAGAWFLFSSHKILQRSALWFFILFHLYSAIIVGQAFPTIIMPWLILLFGIGFTAYKNVPLAGKSYPGWVFMACLVFFQIIPILIPANEDFTQEGSMYSLHMINVNNQCRYTLAADDRILKKGTGRGPEITSNCWIYGAYYRLHNRFCPSSQPLNFTYDHSVNGSPYYRIINSANFCSLTYKPFSHNSWIGDNTNSAAVAIARKSSPVTDYTLPSSMLTSSAFEFNSKIKGPQKENEIAGLDNTQHSLIPYLALINTAWWSLWWGLLAYLFSHFLLFSTLDKERHD